MEGREGNGSGGGRKCMRGNIGGGESKRRGGKNFSRVRGERQWRGKVIEGWEMFV